MHLVGDGVLENHVSVLRQDQGYAERGGDRVHRPRAQRNPKRNRNSTGADGKVSGSLLRLGQFSSFFFIPYEKLSAIRLRIVMI